MIAGAAAGAAQSLEEILAAQMFKAKLAEQQAMDAKRMQMDEARLNESIRQNDLDEKFRTRQEDRVAAGDRKQSNAEGVRRMIGEGITRRVPLDDMQGMAFAEGIDLPKEDKPRKVQYTYTDPKSGNKSLRFASEDQIPEGGLDLGNEPQKPSGGGGPRTPHFVKMPDGSVKDINGVAPPGSTPYDAVADRNEKKRENVHPQVLEYSKGVIRKIDDLIGREDDPATPENEARPNRITQATAGVGGAVRRWAPWNNSAKDVDAELFSLTSELAISALQKMRASSQTGGAVGNVALGEMEIMKNAEAAIRSDQSPANLKRQLGIIRESEQRFLNEMQRDSNANDPGLNRGVTAKPIPGAPDDIDALIDSLRGKPKG